MFSQVCVCPQGEGGTYPGQVQMGGGGTPRYIPHPPARSGQGRGVPQGTYPQPGQGEGVPQGTYPPRPRTCYTAGGMPLAFTQEDFLVLKNVYVSLFIEHASNFESF